jgi:hypothetical protein
MRESDYNRAAGTVSGGSPESLHAVACLEKCLKVLPPEQRDSLLKYYGNESQLPPDLALSILRLQTGTPQLRECLRKCLEKVEDDSLPV